jgi:hypothetical protein
MVRRKAHRRSQEYTVLCSFHVNLNEARRPIDFAEAVKRDSVHNGARSAKFSLAAIASNLKRFVSYFVGNSCG